MKTFYSGIYWVSKEEVPMYIFGKITNLTDNMKVQSK